MPPLRSAVWPDPRVKPPAGVAQVDWSHPLSNGLVFCAIFSEGGGNTFDLAKGLVGTATAGPSGVAFADGLGGDFAAGGSAYYDFAVNSTTDSVFYGNITILWRGVVRTGGDFRHFAGKHAGNGGTNNAFDFRTDNSATPQLSCIRSNATTSCGWGPGPPVVTLNKLQTFGFNNVAGSNSANFYVDGVLTGVTGTGAITPTNTHENIRVGRRADGAVQMDGTVSVVQIWSRVLSVAEVVWATVEPYAMLRPVVRRRYFVPVIAPVGDTFIGAWAQPGLRFVRKPPRVWASGMVPGTKPPGT